MVHKSIVILLFILSGCSLLEDGSPNLVDEQIAHEQKADERFSNGSFVSHSGALVPGKYNIKDSELDQLIVAVTIGQNNEMFLFEPTDSGGWLILNCRVQIDSIAATEDYRLVLSPCREEIMNSKRVRYDVAPEDATYNLITINFSRGLFYGHAEVAFLQNDGGRRTAKGLIEIGK